MIWKRVWVVTAILVLALIAFKSIMDTSWFMNNIVLILGWGLFSGQIVYSNSDKIYLQVQKAIYFLTNPDTQWDLSVKYHGPGLGPESLPVIQSELLKAARFDRPIIKNNSYNFFEIRADELTIEVAADDENFVQVFFTKIPVSYRGANSTMNSRIAPVLESIEKKLSISEKTYWLTVYFGKINPYFGMYMRRLKPEDIVDMNIRVGSSDENNLVISKQKLTITEDSLKGLENSAKKFLALSKVPA